MHVDSMTPTLKAPGTKRLKLKQDVPLSNLAFKFNVCRYNEDVELVRGLILGPGFNRGPFKPSLRH